jgi:hypothetical protein
MTPIDHLILAVCVSAIMISLFLYSIFMVLLEIHKVLKDRGRRAEGASPSREGA